MATTYGAPTGLDLSACSVTATGGSTSQTLADLGKAVSDNATAVATATQNAASANTNATKAISTATAAQTTAASAQTTAAAAQTTANAAIPASLIQKPNGPAVYDASGLTFMITPATSGMAQTAAGNYGTAPNPYIFKIFAGGGSADIDNGADAVWLYRGGTGKQDAAVTLNAASFGSENDGKTALGTASNRWNGVYSISGTVQTSDANEKTVVGVIGDSSYIDSTKLITAGKAIRKAITVFTFNDGGTRKHVGAIAQNVEAALTAAGLVPSDFGIWCQDALTEQVAIKDANGTVTGYKEQPVLDASGNQVYRQSLRYDELSMLLIAAGEAEAQENSAALTALTTRVTALEAKAGA